MRGCCKKKDKNKEESKKGEQVSTVHVYQGEGTSPVLPIHLYFECNYRTRLDTEADEIRKILKRSHRCSRDQSLDQQIYRASETIAVYCIQTLKSRQHI